MVTSTKTGMQRPWVEFVIGNESLIKGFDRALPKMSYGERSKLYFTPTYAYGPEGLPPIIPPDSHMMFDVTVLGFRQRNQWIKPMIQVWVRCLSHLTDHSSESLLVDAYVHIMDSFDPALDFGSVRKTIHGRTDWRSLRRHGTPRRCFKHHKHQLMSASILWSGANVLVSVIPFIVATVCSSFGTIKYHLFLI